MYRNLQCFPWFAVIHFWTFLFQVCVPLPNWIGLEHFQKGLIYYLNSIAHTIKSGMITRRFYWKDYFGPAIPVTISLVQHHHCAWQLQKGKVSMTNCFDHKDGTRGWERQEGGDIIRMTEIQSHMIQGFSITCNQNKFDLQSVVTYIYFHYLFVRMSHHRFQHSWKQWWLMTSAQKVPPISHGQLVLFNMES